MCYCCTFSFIYIHIFYFIDIDKGFFFLLPMRLYLYSIYIDRPMKEEKLIQANSWHVPDASDCRCGVDFFIYWNSLSQKIYFAIILIYLLIVKPCIFFYYIEKCFQEIRWRTSGGLEEKKSPTILMDFLVYTTPRRRRTSDQHQVLSCDFSHNS